ncbi:MAG: Dam family site-specific DNA-(adenine-N6)-methyltransferase [Thermoplasmatales archaeon]
MISYQSEDGFVRIPNLIKWAGGKKNLVDTLMNYVPEEFGTYYEPFFGGGALFWNLKLRGKIENAVISDINPELINLLHVVQSHPNELSEELSAYSGLVGAEHFYNVRNIFNSLLGRKNETIERATMFLYLNRNCYNGLWRINTRGEFNVPFGFYEKYHLPSPIEIGTYSRLLQGTKILCNDFPIAMGLCNDGDFVYLDPPYHTYSGFTQYAGSRFTLNDQIKLANFFKNLARRGLSLVETNSNHPDILDLYREFKITQTKGYSPISSKKDGRGSTDEVIIVNQSINLSLRTA